MIEYTVNDVVYKVRKPNSINKAEARRVYNRAFNEAIANKAMLREEIINLCKARGIWSSQKEAEFAEVRKRVEDAEKILEEGGIELEKAREVALALRVDRIELLVKNANLSDLFEHSAEKQAEFAETQYLMSVCICQKNGHPVCKDLNDFINRYDEEVIVQGIAKYNDLIYGSNTEYYKELPEIKFLIEYGFMDQDLNLIDENGNKIEVEADKVERKPFLKNGVPIGTETESVANPELVDVGAPN